MENNVLHHPIISAVLICEHFLYGGEKLSLTVAGSKHRCHIHEISCASLRGFFNVFQCVTHYSLDHSFCHTLLHIGRSFQDMDIPIYNTV